MPTTKIEQVVQSKYGAVAESGLSSDHAGVKAVAEAFGYSGDELSSIPAEANMGLSCGNPTAFASLREGETVVDLGSGGGLDVFLAAAKVGPTGRAIGIDMTPAMLDLARANAAKGNYANVEFHEATIDRLPLADGSIDCIISNCVINLAPDKPAVFREMARVLKPGGRVAISDIAIKRPLPPELSENLMAYVGCIAGAIEIDAYRRGLLDAGFSAVEIQDSGSDLNAYALVEGQGGCCSPAMDSSQLSAVEACGATTELAVLDGGCCTPAVSATSTIHADLNDLLSRYNVNDFAASIKVFAVKG